MEPIKIRNLFYKYKDSFDTEILEKLYMKDLLNGYYDISSISKKNKHIIDAKIGVVHN